METKSIVYVQFNEWLLNQINQWGIPSPMDKYIHLTLWLVFLILIIGIFTPLLRKLTIWTLTKRTQTIKEKLGDHLVKNRFFAYLIQLLPYVLVSASVPYVFYPFPNWINLVKILVDIYGALLAMWILRALLRSIRDFSKDNEAYRDKPINSYLQVILIVLYILTTIFIFAIITGKSLMSFFTTLGAASAILLLVFKDSILGFVASIQVSLNDMVRVGDWIQMKKYDADGSVIEIGINTVKVQNWDKTITTIPTYSLISDSIINWRGMQESGGRRIKRPIHVKIGTIRFLEEEEIEMLKNIQLLRPYLEERQAEIREYNEKTGADPDTRVNGRHLTNVGTFRKYIELYAQQNRGINQEMSFMVRQLQPTAQGLPIELYFFTTTTVWTEYEGIISDMFDHLLASAKYFHLELFESPASDDLRKLVSERKTDTQPDESKP